MRPDQLPAVCIVGRPNVGKSALFNRMIGRRKAVVHHAGGTTRDRIEALFESQGRKFRLIDTGGFVGVSNDKIISLVKRQIEEAITEADLLLFVCDVTCGITPGDEEVVSLLRKTQKKVFVVVNKVDNKELEDDVYDFYRFGLGDPHPVSAIHNIGIGDLIEEIAKSVGATRPEETPEVSCRVAIAGRPNVGKSLFLNTLLKKERVIVDKAPGTTRDSIDTYFEKDGRLYLLIDTAGIRHKSKVKEAVDIYSISRSHEAINNSDAVLLLIDGYDGMRLDDIRIFEYTIEAGKCCVLVVNKWDLVKGMPMATYKNAILNRYPVAGGYPIVFASAKTSRNVLSCIDMARFIVANASQNIPMKELVRFLANLKKSPKPRFVVQTGVRPPGFLFFVTDVKIITREYTKFLEHGLRRTFNFYGTPIRIQYKRKKDSQ